jgi:hypothetical protein
MVYPILEIRHPASFRCKRVVIIYLSTARAQNYYCLTNLLTVETNSYIPVVTPQMPSMLYPSVRLLYYHSNPHSNEIFTPDLCALPNNNFSHEEFSADGILYTDDFYGKTGSPRGAIVLTEPP